MSTYGVAYQYGSYSGTVVVHLDGSNNDNEQIIAAAKHQLRPHMSLPMAYERYDVVSVEHSDEG